MRKLLLICLMVALLCAATQAQTQVKSEQGQTETASPQLSQEQQQRIAAAIERAQRAAVEERAALQHAQDLQGDNVPQAFREKATDSYLLARAKREAVEAQSAADVYLIMAQLRASPEEFELRRTQGGYTLTKRQPPQPPASTATPTAAPTQRPAGKQQEKILPKEKSLKKNK